MAAPKSKAPKNPKPKTPKKKTGPDALVANPGVTLTEEELSRSPEGF